IVVFGDVIQLFHVKSGKYLTVLPDLLAKDERENIRVTLDVLGCSTSWLQILPRYKIDREGDRILSRSEVYLRSAERHNEYIHRADRDPLPGSSREVNCSLESTSWRLNIFRSSTDSLDANIILAR
ncbi:inositol 1,4,5-trisphosphate/ryanodine receptor-domain-containing protein, partial [Ochromonadaceae sp. CCMP2298]